MTETASLTALMESNNDTQTPTEQASESSGQQASFSQAEGSTGEPNIAHLRALGDLANSTGAHTRKSRAKSSEETHGTDAKDRRGRHRAIISAPIRVKTLGGEKTDEVSTTIDVSRDGVFFVTPLTSYRTGIEVASVFPYSGNPAAPHAERIGRIVRVVDMGAGRHGVAISFGTPQAVAEPQAAPMAAAAEAPARKSQRQETAGPKCPLVIAMESDRTAREHLEQFLSGAGYDPWIVSGIVEARKVLSEYAPSLIIIDADTEGGYDLCALVRGTRRLCQVPVLMITQSAYPTDYANAHAVGATVCMARPFKQERFANIVRLLSPPPVEAQPAQELAKKLRPNPRRASGDSSRAESKQPRQKRPTPIPAVEKKSRFSSLLAFALNRNVSDSRSDTNRKSRG